MSWPSHCVLPGNVLGRDAYPAWRQDQATGVSRRTGPRRAGNDPVHACRCRTHSRCRSQTGPRHRLSRPSPSCRNLFQINELRCMWLSVPAGGATHRACDAQRNRGTPANSQESAVLKLRERIRRKTLAVVCRRCCRASAPVASRHRAKIGPFAGLAAERRFIGRSSGRVRRPRRLLPAPLQCEPPSEGPSAGWNLTPITGIPAHRLRLQQRIRGP